jgi:ribosomal protein S18 acetylase RimI-like enzyme
MSEATELDRRGERSTSGDARRLSELLWGIRWSEHLPFAADSDVTVVESTIARAAPFIQAEYPRIFGEQPDAAFRASEVTAAKLRYYEHAGDVFEFVRDEKTIGVVVGNAVDWSTYYFRSAALVPEYRGTRLAEGFLRTLLGWLAAAGLERVTADTAPSNAATVGTLTRLGFMITGSTLSERFGALTHFTCFLDQPREATFVSRFCAGVHPRPAPPARTITEERRAS